MARSFRAWAMLAAGGMATFSLAAAAQLHVTGAFTGSDGTTSRAKVTFECTGNDPCIGSYRASIRDDNCTNTFTFADRVTITGGLVPPTPGPIAVTFIGTNLDNNDVTNPDGTCSVRPGTVRDIVLSFVGQWDGQNGTLDGSHTDHDGTMVSLLGSYTSDVAPPFPMTVHASVDAVSASATADILYRPQDVGTNASVFVFALAPAAAVKGLSKVDATLPCVLAQLNAAGQLVSVSAQSMQAFISGVLSASGQAVTILNGVPTVQIAGATFIVGYGSTAASMISSGTTRAAVTVPGTAITCKAERPQTGWWWNPAEGGRGFSIEAREDRLFMASYLYDANGQSSWLYAAGKTTLEGAVFQGPLAALSGGQTLAGNYQAPHDAPSPGPIALTFQDATHGVLSWPGGNIAIERFAMVPNGLAATRLANQPQSGWWWNESEGGRGFFIEWQGANAFLATYMYNANGTPIWYSSQAATPDIGRFNGVLQQYSNGQTLAGSYHLPTLPPADVGAIGMVFTGLDTATITLPGGRQVALKRFAF